MQWYYNANVSDVDSFSFQNDDTKGQQQSQVEG
jgi:hypothetical protein